MFGRHWAILSNSITFFFLNSRLKKHIQMSETDNFIRIEMTALESAVEVIEGETLLWEEFLYSCPEDPSLKLCSGRSSSPDGAMSGMQGQQYPPQCLQGMLQEKMQTAVCSPFAPQELSYTRNGRLPCLPEQELVCGVFVIWMSAISYMVRSCSTLFRSSGSWLLNSHS